MHSTKALNATGDRELLYLDCLSSPWLLYAQTEGKSDLFLKSDLKDPNLSMWLDCSFVYRHHQLICIGCFGNYVGVSHWVRSWRSFPTAWEIEIHISLPNNHTVKSHGGLYISAWLSTGCCCLCCPQCHSACSCMESAQLIWCNSMTVDMTLLCVTVQPT